MVILTTAARARLEALLREHPEERLVRIAVTDVDEQRLAMSLTLEGEPHPDDEVMDLQGLTIAIPRASMERLAGVTLDYTDSGAFQFRHPTPPQRELRVISLN